MSSKHDDNEGYPRDVYPARRREPDTAGEEIVDAVVVGEEGSGRGEEVPRLREVLPVESAEVVDGEVVDGQSERRDIRWTQWWDDARMTTNF
jgi:hypothetical protein